MLTRAETMMRLLRGDFNTLDKLANNPYGNTSGIYWGMRTKGWNLMQGIGVKQTGIHDFDRAPLLYFEGSPQWQQDLLAVLKSIKYDDN